MRGAGAPVQLGEQQLKWMTWAPVHSIPRHGPVPEQAFHPGPQAGGFWGIGVSVLVNPLSSRRLGLLGALLYTLSCYRLVCVYTRAAAGEFTAMAFFPLVLAGLYGIYTRDKPRFADWLPMSLGMAAMVQSHLLSCELTALLLILFCLLRLRETLRPARLLAWVKAALLAVGLSAWYLFPFFISTRSIPFLVNRSDLVGKLQKHGLYAVQLFSFFGTAGGSSAEGTTHDMALTPGLPLLLALALAFYCLWRTQARGDTRPAAKHLYTTTGFAVLTLVLSLHALSLIHI